MGIGRWALTCAQLTVLLLIGAFLASCGGSARLTVVRPTIPLPIPESAAVHGDFVMRRLTVPAGYGSAGREFFLDQRRTPGPAQPLVLALHGLYQSPIRVERATAATAFSEAHHFTLVYPIGVNEAWNAGSCCRADTANDVGYLVDLVHYVSTLTPVDLHHVYIWGFSNGGMMAWRAVCQSHDVFAGAGVMSGALLVPCRQPVHVVDIHGLDDKTVPYLGGYSHYTHTVIPDSADERNRLVSGSTLKVILFKRLGHEWPPLRRGSFDALSAFWNDLRGYRVAHPATAVSAAVEG